MPKTLTIELRLLKFRKIDSNGCWLWTGFVGPRNYGIMSIGRRSFRVHRLAAVLWLGLDLKSKVYVCHKCDVPTCFNPKHLYLGNAKTNVGDAVLRGQHPLGERHYKAKLDDLQVLMLRAAYTSGVSIAVLAREFNVTPGNVDYIVKNKTWKHLKGGNYA